MSIAVHDHQDFNSANWDKSEIAVGEFYVSFYVRVFKFLCIPVYRVVIGAYHTNNTVNS
jgi:hypothetical protein